jgi:hypothetical protein
MKYLYLVIALCAINSPVDCFQQPQQEPAVETSALGIAHYGKDKFESLKFNGRMTLEGTKISGPVEVNGSLSAQDATIGSLNVTGHSYLSTTQVKGKALIDGFFSADKTTFGDELVVKAHRITLRECNVGTIIMKKVLWPFDNQVVELTDGTRCSGNVIFESGKGRLILRNGSTCKGEVLGGDLQKEVNVGKN